MPFINMVGPHAIGKTTTIRRWAARYSGLTAISCDLNLIIHDGVESRERGWQGTADEKRKLVEKYQQANQVTVVESARTTTLQFIKPNDHVIVVTCDWQLFKQHMLDRCEAKGKKFRAEYWTDGKLQYECGGRYLNFAAKHLTNCNVITRRIVDQQRDWAELDEVFYSLYRRLNNTLNR